MYFNLNLNPRIQVKVTKLNARVAAAIRSQDETADSMALIRRHNQFAVTLPDQLDRIGKQRIISGDPPVHGCRIDPFTIVDFVHLQHQWTIETVLIHHAMFVTGPQRRWQLKQRLQWPVNHDAQFFADFATGTIEIIFTTIDMAGG